MGVWNVDIALPPRASSCHYLSMSGSEPEEIDWDSVQASAVSPARFRWPSEVRHLTPWVIDNLDDLGQELRMHLDLIGTEVLVGTFKADIAAKDGSGRLVIIENQLGPSDHGHFGQVVLYACEAKADAIIWLVATDVRLFISGGIRPEHRRALQRLNEVFAGTIEFYGVQVSLESEPRPLSEPDGPVFPRIAATVRPNPRPPGSP